MRVSVCVCFYKTGTSEGGGARADLPVAQAPAPVVVFLGQVHAPERGRVLGEQQPRHHVEVPEEAQEAEEAQRGKGLGRLAEAVGPAPQLAGGALHPAVEAPGQHERSVHQIGLAAAQAPGTSRTPAPGIRHIKNISTSTSTRSRCHSRCTVSKEL